jgi:hypothetical protein
MLGGVRHPTWRPGVNVSTGVNKTEQLRPSGKADFGEQGLAADITESTFVLPVGPVVTLTTNCTQEGVNGAQHSACAWFVCQRL